MSTKTRKLNIDPAQALTAFTSALQGLVAAGLLPADQLVGLTMPAAMPATAEAKPTTPEPGPEPVLVSTEATTPVTLHVAATKRPIAPNHVDDFIKWFITSPEENLYTVSRGQWSCTTGHDDGKDNKSAHVLRFHSKVEMKGTASNVICIRPIGSKVAIFNASRITYGTSWAAQKTPQAIAESAGAVPIPFENVADKKDGAGLDLSKLEIIDWTGPEDMIIPPINASRWNTEFHVVKRHFAGAAVVKVEHQYFLFDTDREEIEWFGFNPFFTQLPGPASTVKEAYSLLMPEAVHMALKLGRKVHRQGEFFFVAVDEGEVLGHINIRNDIDLFFYNQVRDRMLDMGALVVNSNNMDSLHEVLKFIGKTKDHNGGCLQDSDIQAQDVLQPLIGKLSAQVGASISHVPTGEDQDMYFKGGHNTLTRDHIKRELAHRLSDGNLDPDIVSRATDGNLSVFYSALIGEQSEDAGGNRRWNTRHQATGVLEVTAGHAYAIGAVIHQGREHRPLYLDGWYRVYPNTATANWTVSGDCD